MKRSLSSAVYALLALLVGGCLPQPKTACRSHDDCREGRVCVAGTCRPKGQDAAASDTPQTSSPDGLAAEAETRLDGTVVVDASRERATALDQRTDGPHDDANADVPQAADAPSLGSFGDTNGDAAAQDGPLADSAAGRPEGRDTADAPADSASPQADSGNPDTGIKGGHTRAWEPAQNIENDLRNPNHAVSLAVDPVNEHVYVAWSESVTVNVKRWNRTTSVWEKTVVLEDRGDPDSPAIGVDGSGNVLLAWAMRTGIASENGVWVSRSTDGATWSSPVRITAAPASQLQLAVARNGTAHAAYTKLGNGLPLFTAYFDGTNWTENSAALFANELYYDLNAKLVVSGTGDGLLLFSQWGLAASVLTGKSFSAPIILNPNYASVSGYDHSIAVNRKGQGMVLWTEAKGSNSVLLGRTYDPGVGWSSVLPPIVLSSTVTATAVTLDEQNNATLFWQQDWTSGADMMGWHGAATGPWKNPTPLETDNIAGGQELRNEFGSPCAAIDGSGNVLAVWRKKVSTTTGTFGAYASGYVGGAWLPQAKLGLKEGLDIAQLSVSVADSGFGAAVFLYASDATTADPDAYNLMVSFFR